MLGRTDSRARLILLLCFLGLFAGALVLRLAYWQIGQGDDLRRLAGQQAADTAETQTKRGEIVDSRGIVLATTAYRDRLVAYPDLLPAADRADVARRLGAILDLDGGAMNQLVETFKLPVPYTVVARRLTIEQSDLVREGLRDESLAKLKLEPQPLRFYPNDGGSPDTTLASQLLGFVTEDGQGSYGIEQYGQDLLAGASGATADLSADALALPETGGQVALTIDASLQLRLEKELYAAWVADRAPRVTGLVMDPYTGAILAWASVPGYDANDYANTAEIAPELFADPIVSQVYEPGSVMKMFTAAAALEAGVVTLQTPVADAKVLRLGPNEVRNGDFGTAGVIPFADIIARSRNVGTGRVALSLGETTDEGASVLYNMWQRLGIGRTTGIELGNESSGIVADPALHPWQQIDLVNRAFGQGVAVTPLQLATGFSAMVNGGRLPVPHLIAALGDEEVVAEGQQIMESDLSALLRQLMVHVVEAGPHYADETLIPGYVVGGKTGTAQIWDQRAGDWMADSYNHTFVGFVGAEQPEAVILVRIHDTKPRVERNWGMTLEMSSNELFRRVALDTISVLEIPPLGGTETPLPLPTYPPDSAVVPARDRER
ncbi:MAG: peptidoglycan D,D-transpeptidase FtsI family protein [Candidatus Limnocylindrales bacterium]